MGKRGMTFTEWEDAQVAHEGWGLETDSDKLRVLKRKVRAFLKNINGAYYE
jgi:hypothetical protein